jgi:hypothetical protein
MSDGGRLTTTNREHLMGAGEMFQQLASVRLGTPMVCKRVAFSSRSLAVLVFSCCDGNRNSKERPTVRMERQLSERESWAGLGWAGTLVLRNVVQCDLNTADDGDL